MSPNDVFSEYRGYATSLGFLGLYKSLLKPRLSLVFVDFPQLPWDFLTSTRTFSWSALTETTSTKAASTEA